jgi:hypothetical protein
MCSPARTRRKVFMTRDPCHGKSKFKFSLFREAHALVGCWIDSDNLKFIKRCTFGCIMGSGIGGRGSAPDLGMRMWDVFPLQNTSKSLHNHYLSKFPYNTYLQAINVAMHAPGYHTQIYISTTSSNDVFFISPANAAHISSNFSLGTLVN